MQQPSEEEKRFYYYGLASRPRLVARSNFTTPWTQKWDGRCMVPKTIGAIGNQDIVQDIRDKYNPEKIIACLVGIDWTTIDMVRIGEQHNTSDPIILWVGVTPESLPWQEAVEVACRCREVLLEAGLGYIHCEIRESTIQRAVSTQQAVSVIPLQEANNRPSLSAELGGQAIAAESSPSKEGTLGLYLSVSGIRCALVSRHAVGDNDHSPLNGQHIIMPGQTTYEAICDQIKANLKASTTQKEKEAYQSLITHLDKLEELASRRIGYVLFSPSYVPTTRIGYDIPWLPDYALVALDGDRLGKEDLSNTVQVYITPKCSACLEKHQPGIVPYYGPLKLKGTFTPGVNRVVGKHGRSTNLT